MTAVRQTPADDGRDTRVLTVVRAWARAATCGLVLALLFAMLVASRRPEWPSLVTVTVFTAAVWPVLTAGLQMLWFDRHRSQDATIAAEDDVETARVREASAAAFALTMGGLVFLQGIGDVLEVRWMAPVGLTHALALGIGTFTACWVRLRVRGR